MDLINESVIFTGIFIAVIWIWIRHRKKNLKFFEELGIPGPPPHFFFGNIIELNKKGQFQCHKEWIEKYGKIVGFYHGMKPILLVAEPDLLKKIFITDFNLFSDRPDSIPLRVHTFLDCVIPASDIMDSVLPNLKGEKWKIVRQILSPTFSIKKLKMMIPAVNEVTDIALKILKQRCQDGDDVDIYEVLEHLTLDLICAQAFAMNINTLQRTNDPLLRSAKVIFDLPFNSSIIFFGKCFPELSLIAMMINLLQMFIRNKGYIPPLKITKVLDEIIKERRKNPQLRRPDLLQSLMDASLSQDTEEKSINSGSSNFTHFQKSKTKLTDLEVKSNALVVFLAGYETTSSALAYAFHYLAKYPELQLRIQKEIDDLLAKEDELDYYNVGSLQLLERFMLETMRFKPPAVNNINRLSVTDVDYGYIRIPKGVQIDVPVDYIHHSEEFFDDPHEFNPDRFLPGNGTKHATVNYWAFGIGPRSCIGTRLVNLTTKIILLKILHKFTILPSLQEKEVKSEIKVSTMTPARVLVRLQERQKRTVAVN